MKEQMDFVAEGGKEGMAKNPSQWVKGVSKKVFRAMRGGEKREPTFVRPLEKKK